MDTFDYVDSHKPPQRSNVSGLVINILTILVLLGTACVGIVFLNIFTNPSSAFNPFPVPSLPPTLEFPTPLPTVHSLPPTWTQEPTPLPTSTATPRPSSTPPPTPTELGALPPTTDPTVQAAFAFAVQQGNPVAISSAAFHPDYGCAWMGIAGQALDMNGGPINDQVVRVGGVVGGVIVPDEVTLTGAASQYGAGAWFEFTLADRPIASRGSVWIQLEDLYGSPLSDRIYFDTYADCEKNLIIINFKRVR